MAEIASPANLTELIARQRWEELRIRLKEVHFSDIAEMLAGLPPAQRAIVFRLLDRDHAAEVFGYLPPDDQAELIHSLSAAEVKVVLDEMRPDDRTKLFGELPAEVTRKLLETLSPEELRESRELLGYPADSVGRYMTPHYVAISPDMTAGEALDHIRKVGQKSETLNVIYILDSTGKLLEDIRLGSLVMAEPQTKITDIADPALVSLHAIDDRESALALFEKYDRVALPVTDMQGNMLGIVTVDDMLDVAQSEATEDIQKIGGSEALDAPYMEVGLWEMIRKRGGWLSALFLGEMLTATAMSFFEGEIAKAVVLALFVPLIISSGGNSGSQAASLIIRALALREVKLRDWFRVFGRELVAGLALGFMLGVIGFFRIVLWQHLHLTNYGQHYLLLAFTVWASLIGVVMFGTFAGSMLPFIMRRLGFDPAASSAPFVATLVDVTGLCIYFSVALLILHGTLL
jgi:magnesium transporter